MTDRDEKVMSEEEFATAIEDVETKHDVRHLLAHDRALRAKLAEAERSRDNWHQIACTDAAGRNSAENALKAAHQRIQDLAQQLAEERVANEALRKELAEARRG